MTCAKSIRPHTHTDLSQSHAYHENKSANTSNLLSNTDGDLLSNTDGDLLSNTDDDLLSNTDGDLLSNTDGDLLSNTDYDLPNLLNQSLVGLSPTLAA